MTYSRRSLGFYLSACLAVGMAAIGAAHAAPDFGSNRGPTGPDGSPTAQTEPDQLDPHGRVVRVMRDLRTINYPEPEADGDDPGLGAPAPGATEPTAPFAADDAPTIVKEWQHAVFGTGIGAAGLFVVDLDGDGAREIVSSASSRGGFSGNDEWYVLRPVGSAYDHSWVSPVYGSGVAAMDVADVDDDGDPDVIVASGSRILVYDGLTLEQILEIHTAVSVISSIRAADLDSDGDMEFALCGSSGIWVYSMTGSEVGRFTGRSDSSLDVGNVDADPGLEIVTNGNYNYDGLVLDGATLIPEWTFTFGHRVRVGDLDGDGKDEIAVSAGWYRIIVYDADVHSPKYEIPTDLDIGALVLADVENDGSLELLYGDGQWGDIHVVGGATGVEKWHAYNPEHGVTNIAVGDSDNDGINEVLWGAGWSSTGPDYLFVVGANSRQLEWKSDDLGGPFLAMDHGDVDGDGRPELVYASFESDSGYGDGIVFVRDAATKALEWRSEEPTGVTWTGLWRVRTAQLDEDPQLEILVTAGFAYDGILLCWDGLTHEEQWRARIPSGLTFRSLATSDLDGDGTLEVIAGTGRDHTGAPGLYLYVFDGASGAVLWRSVDLGSYWGSAMHLRIAQLDADPGPEIAVAINGAHLVIIDGSTRLEQLRTAGLSISSLETPDDDGDGLAELYIGDTSGRIRRLDPATGQPIREVGTYGGGTINGLVVRDLTGDGSDDFLFGIQGEVFLYSGADPARLLWRSGVIGSSVGAWDSIMVADIDGDEKLEFAVNLGPSGIAAFKIGGRINRRPVANAGPDRSVECQTDLHATVVLDGSGSSDPDSTPGTADDIVAYEWTEDGLAIASGVQATVGMALGAHGIRLRAVDKAGAAGADTAEITVVDTLAPTGVVVSPAPADCIGPAHLPVTVVDDFIDACGQNITRSWSPGPGPFYEEHGDHHVEVTATDSSGNAATASVDFSIDRIAPRVAILEPENDRILIPDAMPFRFVFSSSDDDGAIGDPVFEQLLLLDREGGHSCVAHDGRTYGDGDGLLSDEVLILDQPELCRIAKVCGFSRVEGADLRIESVDCAGNVGFSTRRLPGRQELWPGVCDE